MPIKYGAKKQNAKLPSTSPALNKIDKRFIQQVCGKFLFLGRAVDPTLLCPISAIASQSAQPTDDTMKQTHQLLDYLASQEDVVLTYKASDMILGVHSDASYLSEPNARSRAGGHFFLSNNAAVPPNNGAILNIAHIIKHVMASATEAKLGALYITAREAVYLRIILEELGHRQPATPIQTDNAMAKVSSTARSNPNAQKPWTCVSIGCLTASVKNNFASTGVLVNSTMPITGPNITPPPTTKTFAKNSSHRMPLLKCYASTSNYRHGLPPQRLSMAQNMPSCKGVMITYYHTYPST
eukprot:CCRYP_012778-RE/>CCRYP_012778-RE protein AED:0.38 eAED:0.42 QI:0/-1/0/1/-1/1/1/0/296